jgi:putative inorganic carbon (HCO3(-)) transporter
MNIGILFVFGVVAIAALFVPQIGVVAAYFVGVLNPQSVWWWNFDGFRPVLFVTAPLAVGFLVWSARNTLHWGVLTSKVSVALAVVLVACAVSTFAAPYAVRDDTAGIRNAAFVLEVQLKLVLLFWIASLCMWPRRWVVALGWMVAAVSIYFVYWANDRYLHLGFVRRLAGPTALDGGGPYADENNFAALFVGSLSFIWFLSFSIRTRLIRWGLWIIIPLAWHAIFLTGSRGGLLGISAVLLCVVLRGGHRIYGALLIIGFILALVFQGGETMKERAATIDDYRDEMSASSRLDAWVMAVEMMARYPGTGVGPGAFVRAFAALGDREPLQAHNTYLQVGAEYGPIAGFALLFAVLAAITTARSCANMLRPISANPEVRATYLLCEALLASLIGLFVCSMFLTLQLFELLYLLLLMTNLVGFLAPRLIADYGGDASRVNATQGHLMRPIQRRARSLRAGSS